MWDRLEVADQVDYGWGRDAFNHKEEASLATYTYPEITGKATCKGPSISLAAISSLEDLPTLQDSLEILPSLSS